MGGPQESYANIQRGQMSARRFDRAGGQIELGSTGPKVFYAGECIWVVHSRSLLSDTAGCEVPAAILP